MTKENGNNKCPVCKGTGKAFDPYIGKYTDKDCLACEGTGLAPWSAEFKAMGFKVDSAPTMRSLQPGGEDLPFHVKVSQYTASYAEYCRKIRGHGLDPMGRESIVRKRYDMRQRGHDGLKWLNKWTDQLKELLFSSKSYPHFVMMVVRHNRTSDDQLPIKDSTTVRAYRAKYREKCQYDWSNSTYAIERLKSGAPTGDLQLPNTFREIIDIAVGSRHVWEIQDGKNYEGLGTTTDLKKFLQFRCGALVRTPVSEYIAWLRERRERCASS